MSTCGSGGALPASMLARSGQLPACGDYAFAVKWDGFRAIVSTEDQVRVRSRRGWNMTERVPELTQLPTRGIFDGELIAFGCDGLPSFPAVCQRLLHNDRTIALTYMVFQSFTNLQREMDEQVDLFVLRHGWPIPLTLPMSVYRRIVTMAHNPKRAVTASMVYSFRPRSRLFRLCTNPLFSDPLLESRKPLIRQVLRAHRRGDYYLVINGLMPLVEGVLVDGVFEGEMAPETGATRKAVNRLSEEVYSPFGMVGAVHAIERLVVSGAAGMGLFQSAPRSTYAAQGEPRSLNRHAILHGFARRYASEANALRMILRINVIVQVIGSVEPNDRDAN